MRTWKAEAELQTVQGCQVGGGQGSSAPEHFYDDGDCDDNDDDNHHHYHPVDWSNVCLMLIQEWG
jgi:hypothetical protein